MYQSISHTHTHTSRLVARLRLWRLVIVPLRYVVWVPLSFLAAAAGNAAGAVFGGVWSSSISSMISSSSWISSSFLAAAPFLASVHAWVTQPLWSFLAAAGAWLWTAVLTPTLDKPWWGELLLVVLSMLIIRICVDWETNHQHADRAARQRTSAGKGGKRHYASSCDYFEDFGGDDGGPSQNKLEMFPMGFKAVEVPEGCTVASVQQVLRAKCYYEVRVE